MNSAIIPGRHGWQVNFSLLFLVVTLSSIPNITYAQKSAADWFKAGMKASSPDEKIYAFEKVVELDPNYTEGYYYLGIAYKSKQKYPEAETALNKAYFKNPYILSNNIKTQILYELGIVYEVLGKEAQAEDALRGAKGLTAMTDKIRGQICFRLGKLYAKQGKVEEAIAEFSEGKNILPQEGARFSQAVAETQAQASLNDQYNQGLALLRAGRYEKSLEQFNMIIKLQPDFRNVQSKALEVQKLLDDRVESREITNLYNEAIAKARNDKLDNAIRLLQQVVAKDSNFKDAALKLRDFQSQNQSKPTEEDPAEKYYQQGRRALQREKWREAIVALTKTQNIRTNYKDTDALLLQAQSNADTEKKLNDSLERLYQTGLRSFKTRDFAGALRTFQTLKSKQPDYKNVDAVILEIEDILSSVAISRTDSLFNAGVIALRNSDWLDAILAFEKVKLLEPGYPDINNKLADARFNYERRNTPSNKHNETESSGITLSQVLASLMVVPLALAFILIAPGARARIYLMRGDYLKASAIYERLLMKNPGRIKLYSILANIYLLENRRDLAAMKIFETIIKMNIYASKRQEINTIVAHHYLTEGRQDATAIAVMERELDSRLQNLNGE